MRTVRTALIFALGVLTTLVLGWTYTIDTATPAGSDAPSVIDNRIREAKAGWQERLNVDHYFALTSTQVSDTAVGQHRQVEYYAPISTPTNATNKGWTYTKDVSSVVELHWLDESGNELQLTSGGTINLVSADLVGTLANDTYFTAVNAAGDGTVNLIKANASDVAVLPNGSEMASSTAPTADADIANKKYVDDTVHMTPSTYAGEESVTFGNGLIIKGGSIASTSANSNRTVTFGTAFPSGIISVTTSSNLSSDNDPLKVTAASVSALTVQNTAESAQGGYWMAMGY